MITGIEWLESELKRHKDALDNMNKIEKFLELSDALNILIPSKHQDLIEKEEKIKESLAQDKYKAKMYISMLNYAIRNHMEFKDYRE